MSGVPRRTARSHRDETLRAIENRRRKSEEAKVPAPPPVPVSESPATAVAEQAAAAVAGVWAARANEVWHKPFSYTVKGKVVNVKGHWERKPGTGAKPEGVNHQLERYGDKFWCKRCRWVFATAEVAVENPCGPKNDAAPRVIPVKWEPRGTGYRMEKPKLPKAPRREKPMRVRPATALEVRSMSYLLGAADSLMHGRDDRIIERFLRENAGVRTGVKRGEGWVMFEFLREGVQ